MKELSTAILPINIESLPEYLTTPVQIRAAPFCNIVNKRFIVLQDGEKVNLYKGKIKLKDKIKVIPGVPGVKKLREDIKKLKPIKINYSKLK